MAKTPHVEKKHGTATVRHAENPAAPEFKVRATKLGFLDQRRRPGDVFLVTEAQFAETWMEKVDASTPLQSQSLAESRREDQQTARAAGAGLPRLQHNAADPIDDEDDDDGKKKPTGDKSVLG